MALERPLGGLFMRRGIVIATTTLLCAALAVTFVPRSTAAEPLTLSGKTGGKIKDGKHTFTFTFTDKATGKTVGSQVGTVTAKDGQLDATVPSPDLSPGEYNLSMTGTRPGEAYA